MDIKIITLDDKFIDAISSDCDLIDWAQDFVFEHDFDIEFYNGGHVTINDESIIFKADNGILELKIITKTI
jgi:hypothetical protein